MKKISIKNKLGIETNWLEVEDPTPHINEWIRLNTWGKPERWQLEKTGDSPSWVEAYDIDDVIDSEDRLDEVSGELVHWVKLKADYSFDITDVTYEHDLDLCIASRIAEYPNLGAFLNAFFDGGQEALDELHAARLAVKLKYPKPVKP